MENLIHVRQSVKNLSFEQKRNIVVIVVCLILLIFVNFTYSQTEIFLHLLRILFLSYILNYLVGNLKIEKSNFLKSCSTIASLLIILTGIQIFFILLNQTYSIALQAVVFIVATFFVFKRFYRLHYVEALLLLVLFSISTLIMNGVFKLLRII